MVVISSRFKGPREVREPDGTFEAVLPAAATQFEVELQREVFASKLDNAHQRNSTHKAWFARKPA